MQQIIDTDIYLFIGIKLYDMCMLECLNVLQDKVYITKLLQTAIKGCKHTGEKQTDNITVISQ